MLKNIFSLSTLATGLTVLYVFTAVKNLSQLMYPLQGVDLSSYPPSQLVKPLWKTGSSGSSSASNDERTTSTGMKVYLSTRERFALDFLKADISESSDTVLLWEEDDATVASLARSFILSGECNGDDDGEQTCSSSPSPSASSPPSSPSESFQYASSWLDDAEEKHALESGNAGVVTAMHHAGEGIESTSIILSLANIVSGGMSKVTSLLKGASSEDAESSDAGEMMKAAKASRSIVAIPPESPIWQSLLSNSTVHVHVVLTRHPNAASSPPADIQEAAMSLRQSFQTHNSILGHVSMVKYDAPNHITKPRRHLYHDIIYVIRRYVLGTAGDDEPKPWDVSESQSEEYEIYGQAQQMKADGVGYPYWKPEVSVKLVSDDLAYPDELVGRSGMEVVQLQQRSADYESGYAYLPGLRVDEIGLTSEKYVALNETVTALPLRIMFDRNDVESEDAKSSGRGGVSQGGLSPARWRLLSHFSQALESQRQLGFEQSDIDDLRRLIAETNITLLGITMLASSLHLLFEFLTFKSDIDFWKGNRDLTGLSIRALFMDFISQLIVLLYLIEMDSSLLMTVPSAFGVLIALWKCQRGSGLKFVKVTVGANEGDGVMFYNKLFRLFGFELSATRLRVNSNTRKRNGSRSDDAESPKSSDDVDLVALSIETDALATRTLGKYVLLPVVLGYTMHSLIMEKHPGWYTWLIVSASSAVYALGFVMMTPQLFLNYKLKSVAHLPWRVLGFRFINTFIDDLFAFIIRMPTMARISCFRDDIVFIIYLYQRWLYPVDTSRPVEGGGMDAISSAAAAEALRPSSIDDEKEKKKNQ